MLKVAGGGGATGAVSYQGTWNASTNTPTLTSSVGNQGNYYVVNVAGTTNLNGITDWQVGDWAVFNGTVWQKVDNTDAVTSVNGQTGTVVLGVANIAGAVPNTVNVLAGGLLSGGGALTGNVTISLTNVPVANVTGAVPNTVNVLAGTGLSGGGALTGNVTLNLANTAVTAATYGNASSVAQVTIDAQGRITNAVNVAIQVASGNVTGLGTMATQNASNVAITGGTINIPNLFQGYTATTAANATTVLTAASNYFQKITASGANTQTFTLPDATTLPNGAGFVFDNDAGGNVTINDNSSALVDVVIPGAIDFIFLESNSTSAGLWGKYSWLPAAVNWGSTTADFANVSVSNVTIAGGTINVQTVNMTANTASTATFATPSLPLVPAGYLSFDLNGTVVKVPYYAV